MPSTVSHVDEKGMYGRGIRTCVNVAEENGLSAVRLSLKTSKRTVLCCSGLLSGRSRCCSALLARAVNSNLAMCFAMFQFLRPL